ncbi:threonine/serine exporter family protein [Alicyclobacillus sp. SO9]|uniref:threonine/serine exporter family protein n=1 Tax=Alicyclobacillus sp. SO9 TaxID=2665646 RepID=UPI0018E89C44|nr:threonine/serine exporter family protein [Alicyclobacillus sp. SO9]QQE81365.1 threonine/serine exporter family protein [Alicyclobacillus sp. SO9]
MNANTNSAEQSAYRQSIIKLCLLTGKIMLQNGAETYRVEDTMTRVAETCGLRTHSYVTPTAIIFSIDTFDSTKLVRITERSVDLRKVVEVNGISRDFCSGKIDVADALKSLEQVDASHHKYPVWLQISAAALASACFLIMFNGKLTDSLPALVSGGIGFTVFLFTHRILRIRFFAEFFAAVAIGIVSISFVSLGFGSSLDKIIIGSVMPLVPGLQITNAVRDLMAGHLVAGTSKGIEALLTAFAVGGGIAISLSIL